MQTADITTSEQLTLDAMAVCRAARTLVSNARKASGLSFEQRRAGETTPELSAALAAHEAAVQALDAVAPYLEPNLRPEFTLGRSRNVGSGLYSMGVYYAHGHVPRGHDGYIGHMLRATPFGDTPADEHAQYAEGDTLGYVRHMRALNERLGERGMLAS